MEPGCGPAPATPPCGWRPRGCTNVDDEDVEYVHVSPPLSQAAKRRSRLKRVAVLKSKVLSNELASLLQVPPARSLALEPQLGADCNLHYKLETLEAKLDLLLSATISPVRETVGWSPDGLVFLKATQFGVPLPTMPDPASLLAEVLNPDAPEFFPDPASLPAESLAGVASVEAQCSSYDLATGDGTAVFMGHFQPESSPVEETHFSPEGRGRACMPKHAFPLFGIAINQVGDTGSPTSVPVVPTSTTDADATEAPAASSTDGTHGVPLNRQPVTVPGINVPLFDDSACTFEDIPKSNAYYDEFEVSSTDGTHGVPLNRQPDTDASADMDSSTNVYDPAPGHSDSVALEGSGHEPCLSALDVLELCREFNILRPKDDAARIREIADKLQVFLDLSCQAKGLRPTVAALRSVAMGLPESMEEKLEESQDPTIDEINEVIEEEINEFLR
jgi:hypothetical protein